MHDSQCRQAGALRIMPSQCLHAPTHRPVSHQREEDHAQGCVAVQDEGSRGRGGQRCPRVAATMSVTSERQRLTAALWTQDKAGQGERRGEAVGGHCGSRGQGGRSRLQPGTMRHRAHMHSIRRPPALDHTNSTQGGPAGAQGHVNHPDTSHRLREERPSWDQSCHGETACTPNCWTGQGHHPSRAGCAVTVMVGLKAKESETGKTTMRQKLKTQQDEQMRKGRNQKS